MSCHQPCDWQFTSFFILITCPEYYDTLNTCLFFTVLSRRNRFKGYVDVCMKFQLFADDTTLYVPVTKEAGFQEIISFLKMYLYKAVSPGTLGSELPLIFQHFRHIIVHDLTKKPQNTKKTKIPRLVCLVQDITYSKPLMHLIFINQFWRQNCVMVEKEQIQKN